MACLLLHAGGRNKCLLGQYCFFLVLAIFFFCNKFIFDTCWQNFLLEFLWPVEGQTFFYCPLYWIKKRMKKEYLYFQLDILFKHCIHVHWCATSNQTGLKTDKELYIKALHTAYLKCLKYRTTNSTVTTERIEFSWSCLWNCNGWFVCKLILYECHV